MSEPRTTVSITLPLSPESWARLVTVVPITPAEWDQMIAILAAMRAGLVEDEGDDE